MKKSYLQLFLGVLLVFWVYNGVYFEKLSKRKTSKNTKVDFTAYADSLYYKGILKSNNSIEINHLLTLVKANPDSTFKQYGNRLGIGESAFFMVNAQGKVIEKTADELKLASSNGVTLAIDTKYIFGNAIRDASGLVKLTDFKTNADFNKLSEALNTLIREKVMPPVLEKIKVGDEIKVIGALKLSKKENLELNVLPVRILND